MVFHLTARLHRHEPWFVRGAREEVASLIQGVVGASDADLLAYAVMPTHLHILLRQGRSPLEETMQPLLRRVAITVHTHHRVEGTVFERRYRDTMCRSPDHIRDALIYVHLNPWRAGLCDDSLDFRWMSHAAYLPGSDPEAFSISPGPLLDVLQLFAQAEARTRDALCGDYLTWVGFRMSRDRAVADAGGEPVSMTEGPSAFWGDRAWRSTFGGSWQEDGDGAGDLPDLRDYVVNHLAVTAPGKALGALRGSSLSRPDSRLRAEVVRAAARRGYRTGAIARLFDISPATVSKAKRRR